MEIAIVLSVIRLPQPLVTRVTYTENSVYMYGPAPNFSKQFILCPLPPKETVKMGKDMAKSHFIL